MPIEVTERWSGKSLSLGTPWRGQRVFDVTGTNDEATALAACPQRNDGHPYNPTRLRCTGPIVRERKGPFAFVINCEYILAPYGVVPATGSDPALDPIRVKWDDVEVCEQVDVDLDKRPILGSNGEPFSPGSRPIKYKKLKVVKNFPFWDTTWNRSWENAVNSDTVVLAGVGTFAAEHIRCVTIIPEVEFTPGFTYLPITFLFEVIFDDSLGTYPFQHRYLDQGTYGFAGSANAPSKFVNTKNNNEVIGSPVRLDGLGKPFSITSNADVKVLKDGAAVAPVSNPTLVNWYHFEATADGYIAYYKRVRTAALSPLIAMLLA